MNRITEVKDESSANDFFENLRRTGWLLSRTSSHPTDASEFDDLATIVDRIPKLEHVTTSRPKKPLTRAASRGIKKFATFDEDDISSFALSPITEDDGSSQSEKFRLKKRKSCPASTQIRPFNKSLIPTADTITSVQDRHIMKPKPPPKPKIAVKPSNFSSKIVSRFIMIVSIVLKGLYLFYANLSHDKIGTQR